MAHCRASLGATLALLLVPCAASADPQRPVLLVRGAFRLSSSGGAPAYDKDASAELEKLVRGLIKDQATVALQMPPGPACQAEPSCYEQSFRSHHTWAWAAMELAIAPGATSGDGIERVPIKLRLVPNRAGGPERVAEYETVDGCALRPLPGEARSECAGFIAHYLTNVWLTDNKPPACVADASTGRGRKIGGGVAIALGVGAAIGGSILLSQGLQDRGVEGPCTNSGGSEGSVCVNYATHLLGASGGLLGAGVLGIASGAGLLLLPSTRSGDRTCQRP